MAMYVTRKCPKCSFVIEAFQRDYIDIGPPFLECPNCNTTILLSHIQEWDLKSFWQKVYFISVHCYTLLFWSLLAPMLILFIGPYLARESKEFPHYMVVIMFLSYPITLIILSVIGTKNLSEEIRKSRERMKDPKYLEKLKELRFFIRQ
jgi:hypothetical protein